MSFSQIARLRKTSGPDPSGQEADGLWNCSDVVEVGWENGEGTIADSVSGVADDLGLLSWEVRDAAAILQVLGISESDNASDLSLDSGGEVFHGSVSKSSSLTVTASNEDRIWTLRSSIIEEVSHLRNPGKVGTTWKEVGGEKSSIVDSLNCNSACTKGSLQALSGWWANGRTLKIIVRQIRSNWNRIEIILKGKLTKFPISVEPLAKKKMTGLQPLRVYSFSVIPTVVCRFSSPTSASAGVGTAVARAARVEMMSWNFILIVGDGEDNQYL